MLATIFLFSFVVSDSRRKSWNARQLINLFYFYFVGIIWREPLLLYPFIENNTFRNYRNLIWIVHPKIEYE